MNQDQVEEKCFTVYPLIWSEQQYEEFEQKNSWMYASDGKIGCTPRCEVNNWGVRASCGVNISTQWADGNVTSFGSTRTVQLSSLRKKIHEHRNSKRTKKLLIFLRRQRKMYSLIYMHRVSKLRFNLQLECSGQLIMWQKIANLLKTFKN